jgi:hypothetical protein
MALGTVKRAIPHHATLMDFSLLNNKIPPCFWQKNVRFPKINLAPQCATSDHGGGLGDSPNNFGHFELLICYLKYQNVSSSVFYKLIV